MLNDNVSESPEAFTVKLDSATYDPGGANTALPISGTGTATGNIADNDTANWSISGSPSVTEGFAASYTVHLDGTLQAGQTATINLAVSDINTTSADYADFATAVNNAVAAYTRPATSGTLSYVGGVLTFTSDGTGTTPGTMSNLVISLAANNDGLAEGPEQYLVGSRTRAARPARAWPAADQSLPPSSSLTSRRWLI